jgi:hypothetical protein
LDLGRFIRSGEGLLLLFRRSVAGDTTRGETKTDNGEECLMRYSIELSTTVLLFSIIIAVVVVIVDGWTTRSSGILSERCRRVKTWR